MKEGDIKREGGREGGRGVEGGREEEEKEGRREGGSNTKMRIEWRSLFRTREEKKPGKINLYIHIENMMRF